MAHFAGRGSDYLAAQFLQLSGQPRCVEYHCAEQLPVEIILACTGIQSIAIMLGVAAAVPTTLREKACAFLLVAPTIYILNLFRNVFVIMAYTGQWFPYFPDIAGNGEIGTRVSSGRTT